MDNDTAEMLLNQVKYSNDLVTNSNISTSIMQYPALLYCFLYTNVWTQSQTHDACHRNFPFPLAATQRTLLGLSSSVNTSTYDYLFHTNDTELGRLTSVTALAVLCILILLISACKAFFKSRMSALGRSIGRQRYGSLWEHDNEDRIVKFGEYCFRLLFHSSMAVYGLYFFYDKPWWDVINNGSLATMYIWEGYPNQTIEPAMQWFYLIQAAYNVGELLFLITLSLRVKFVPYPTIIFSNKIRGDFWEMSVHHFVTNCLIFGSSHFGFFIIGSMIFMVHDLSDVPVDLSKLANFMKIKSLTVLFFVWLLIFWLLFRLGILPFVILRSVVQQSAMIMHDGYVSVAEWVVMIRLFQGMLFSLLLLHVFWFVKLVQIALLLIRKGEAHDLSEHKGGEKQD